MTINNNIFINNCNYYTNDLKFFKGIIKNIDYNLLVFIYNYFKLYKCRIIIISYIVTLL